MGFTGEAPPRAQVLAVATVTGTVTALGRKLGKCRVWLLEDRTLVVCASDPTVKKRGVKRHVYDGAVVSSVWSEKAKSLTVTLVGEGDPTVEVVGKGCSCGAGAAGNAGPVEGAYDVVRVRAPEWHTLLP